MRTYIICDSIAPGPFGISRGKHEASEILNTVGQTPNLDIIILVQKYRYIGPFFTVPYTTLVDAGMSDACKEGQAFFEQGFNAPKTATATYTK